MTYQNEYVKHGNKTDAEISEMHYTNQKYLSLKVG